MLHIHACQLVILPTGSDGSTTHKTVSLPLGRRSPSAVPLVTMKAGARYQVVWRFRVESLSPDAPSETLSLVSQTMLHRNGVLSYRILENMGTYCVGQSASHHCLVCPHSRLMGLPGSTVGNSQLCMTLSIMDRYSGQVYFETEIGLESQKELLQRRISRSRSLSSSHVDSFRMRSFGEGSSIHSDNDNDYEVRSSPADPTRS